jgi:hypothetical protein
MTKIDTWQTRPQKDKTVNLKKKKKKSLVKCPRFGLYTKTYWLTDRQLQCDFDTRNSVLDASLSCGYNGIFNDKISTTDQAAIKQRSSRQTAIHPRKQHDPTGRKPSTAGRPEWQAGPAAEAIPVFRQFELVTRLGQSSTSNYVGEVSTHRYLPPYPFHISGLYLIMTTASSNI